jgi:hypothetical protein
MNRRLPQMDHFKALLLKVHKTNFTLIATAVNLEAKYNGIRTKVHTERSMKYTTSNICALEMDKSNLI